jgi:hypothetical protein
MLEVVSKISSAVADDLRAATSSTVAKKYSVYLSGYASVFFARFAHLAAHLVLLATNLFLKPLLGWFAHITEGRRQRGVALVELSAWLVAILPPIMAASVLFATSHDRNMVQMIPESLMREIGGRVMTWRSDRAGGIFEVDLARVRALTVTLANRAQAEVAANTFKLREPSVRACYWVYDINVNTGGPGLILSQGCEQRNDPRGELSDTLLRARARRVNTGIAELVRIAAGAPQEYVSRVVLLGVAIGGVFGGWEGLYEPEPVQHAAVWVPRGDVGL